ncbi:MAG: DUF5596 domain-containing protein [Chloroflexi bacterium]|nr:DUF5596 domain-containing protein [Chloroflexota bacterium]
MRLDELLHHIREPECLEALQDHWDESVRTLPEGGPAFLYPDTIAISRTWGGLGSEAQPALVRAAHRILNDPALTHLAWHCYRQTFEYPEGIDGARWPRLQGVLGDLSGTFYLLVTMAAVPRIRAKHQEMGVGEAVTRDTCRVVESLCTYYRKAHDGQYGAYPHQVYWPRRHTDGLLFRIGRLEYFLTTFREYGASCSVYRNRVTGETIALAPHGWCMTPAGFRHSAVDSPCDDGRWTTSLTHDVHQITGYPLSPAGYAIRRRVSLQLDVWSPALTQDDWVLSMHIPAGDPLTPDVFISSLRRARAFFDRYFPATPSKAIACSSWIFSPILEQLLPATSNLVRNLREVYLLPAPRHGPHDGLWFIFVQDTGNHRILDLSTAEAHTSLERNILDYLRTGGIWRCGDMFVLNEDLDRLGTQFYRSHWTAPA